jgi:glycosyltransferase involved in cell wall biosynthesis
MNYLFFLGDKYPPYRVDISVLIFKKAIDRGHRIDCVIQSEERQASFNTLSGEHLNIHIGPATARRSRVSRALNKLLYLVNDLLRIRLFFNQPHEAVLIKDKFISALPVYAFAGLLKIPVIYWLSYPFPEDALHRARTGLSRYPLVSRLKGSICHWVLYNLLLPCAKHAFVQTREMKRQIAQLGIPIEKMTVLPMGCEIEKIPYYGISKNENKSGKEFRIGYIGSLSKVRRIDFLLRVLNILRRRFEGVTLHLVGGGDEDGDVESLKEIASDLGIADAVLFEGFLPQAQAWERMRNVDVCVSHLFPDPILDVGFPTKLIEYMALGKAIVANSHVEQLSILASSKAGLCVPYSEEAFADAFIYLMKNRLILKKLGSNARRYVQVNYNYNMIADLFHHTLQSQLSNVSTRQ